MKILILGATGMLGHTVADYLIGRFDYDVTMTSRNVISGYEGIYFDALTSDLGALGGPYDYVINCIGIIKPFMSADMEKSIQINALFPWALGKWCEQNGSRLIHITTDCVYSGAKGNYTESDPHDALDAYGKSKSLGECPDYAMILRTSIIGPEIHKYASLVEWAKKQAGKTVKGFTTHLWNGITTLQYAKVCDKIMRQNLFEKGLYHIFAPTDVSKFEMMKMFDHRYELGLTVIPTQPHPIDRTLRTEKELCSKLGIPSVEQMILEM